MNERSDHRRGQAYALAAALAWSTGGILQRQIHAGAADQIVGRAIFACAAVLGFVRFGEGVELRAALRSVLSGAGLLVAAGIAAASATFIVALNHTSVAHVLVIQAITPILAGLFAFWTLHEPLSARTWGAMVLAVVGIAVMVGIPSGGNALGELMAFLSPLSFAVVIVVARRHRHLSMTPATALAQLLLIVFGLPFVHVGQLHTGDIGWLALLGLGQQGFGLVFFTMGARLIPAAAMGLILLLESVLGAAWGWLGTSEKPNVTTVVGGLIVLGAVALKLREDNARLAREQLGVATVP
ncbi:MAG TPA: DMT family transporter [Solirubrobacteraceae bacterium]|jgi:drug/metabolite transporter (DMT)-like permease|nr:DMT family transporter [Solirubrobacteraceae bacterium]